MSSLRFSGEVFGEANLVYLAERSYMTLLSLYRTEQESCQQLAQCYGSLSALYSKEGLAGQLNFAMGTYFRVLFIGQGNPLYLSSLSLSPCLFS